MLSHSRAESVKMFIDFSSQNGSKDHLDIDDESKPLFSEADITDFINEYLSEKKLRINDLNSAQNRLQRDELFVELKVKFDLSARKIADTLGISREIVRIALKNPAI
jgi:hypothetical protein